MQRRTVIKSLALASAGTLFLTGCADKNVVEFITDGRLLLNKKHLDYLSAISEAFVPVKNIEGYTGNAVEFIMTMVNDTHPAEDIPKFAEGFEQYKLLMDSQRLKITTSEPGAVIEQVTAALEADPPAEALVHFINTTRQLAITHFTTSEYYMVNHREYQMIPPPYEACITV